MDLLQKLLDVPPLIQWRVLAGFDLLTYDRGFSALAFVATISFFLSFAFRWTWRRKTIAGGFSTPAAESAPQVAPLSNLETRRYLLAGAVTIILLLGSIGLWSSTTRVSGAVIAPGLITVDTSAKKVQHLSGGIVGEILVKEGSYVRTGDILLRLDETLTRANLQVVSNHLDELAIRKSRLQAELEGAPRMFIPSGLADRQEDPRIAEISQSEVALFASRSTARASMVSQLRERIAQLRNETKGLEAQGTAKRRELELATQELKGLEILETQRLVGVTKITGARRVVAQLEGECAQAEAIVAQTRGKIAEIEYQIAQIDADFTSSTGKELRELQAKESELYERRITAEDQLRRVLIRAPQSGYVHQLSVSTVGGVVGAGETLMHIVPDQDRLIVEAKIAPRDIDQISIGSEANIRFTALDHATTPQITGRVTTVSADLISEIPGRTDAALQYYQARLELNESSDALRAVKLRPGMPAEIHIRTSDRLVVSYFFKPLSDQFQRAFRER